MDNVELSIPTGIRIQSIAEGLALPSSTSQWPMGISIQEKTYIGRHLIHHIPIQNESLLAKDANIHGLLLLPPVFRQAGT